jgi:high-affinity nickel-transport protein
MGPLALAGIGFLLGLRHALDADHVVAVTTIVSRERSFRRAAGIGALWGAGHSASLLLVGGAIIAFRLVVPPRLGLTLELGVAFMLILLGFLNLRPGTPHPHPHPHPHPPFDTRRPILIGVVHGLAGSAAAALLVLATIRDTAAALLYLSIFGLGTIAGMTLVTAMLSLPAVFAANRMERYERRVRVAAGLLSLALGLFIAHQIVVTGGLFSSVPAWTPG